MADENIDDLIKEMKQVTDKQRKFAEENGVNSPQFKALAEKSADIEKRFEEANEAANQKYAAEQKEREELKDRIKDLEGLAAAGASTGSDGEAMKKDAMAVMGAMLVKSWPEFISDPQNEQKAARVFGSMKNFDFQSADAKTMGQFVKRYNEKASSDLLRTDIGEYGGFLCPPEYADMLNKVIIESGPIRRFATVKQVSSKTYIEPIRTSIGKAFRPGEARSADSSISKYGENDFSPQRMTSITPVTQDMLLFNAYDIVNEIMMDSAEQFAVLEGQEFFDGDGVNKGLGWSLDVNVPEYTTAGSGVITFDDMINITGELKRGYDPMYMFNRKSLVGFRLLKDSSGRYLWNPAFGDAASGAPATINGYRYSAEFIEFDDIDAGAGKFPVLFADMRKFYQIVDRADISIIRDEVTQKAAAIIEYATHKYSVGKVKIHEAGVRMKVKA